MACNGDVAQRRSLASRRSSLELRGFAAAFGAIVRAAMLLAQEEASRYVKTYG